MESLMSSTMLLVIFKKYHLAYRNICLIPLVTGCSSFWLLPALRVFGLLYLLLVDNSVEQGILGNVLYREQVIFGLNKIEIGINKKMLIWGNIFQKKTTQELL